jgi:outer membrane protein
MFVLTFSLLAACGAFAQAKVGVVNSQAALAETAEIKKAQADLEAKYKPRQDQMVKIQKDLEGINQQLSLGDKLTPQAQADLNTQGTRKNRDLQRLQEDMQADVDRERNEIIVRSGQRMVQIVQKMAEEKGLDVIIDASNAIYMKPALDLTKDATAAYDKAYPVKK